MFGLFRKKRPVALAPPAAVKLVPFREAEPDIFISLLCDGVTAYHLASFADLLALHARLQHENTGVRVLASLDDLNQAAYTSGHCLDANGLDAVDGRDLSGLDPNLFEDGVHTGFLSTPAEFPIRLANLLEQVPEVQLKQFTEFLGWVGDDGDLVTINEDPEAALQVAREQKVLFQFVPVDAASKAIAAFPNGYFTSGLNPMQNYVLARHLETQYDLALFGIGARFLGFRRSSAFSENEANALATELAALYAYTPSEAAAELARLLIGRDWLLIRYTGN